MGELSLIHYDVLGGFLLLYYVVRIIYEAV